MNYPTEQIILMLSECVLLEHFSVSWGGAYWKQTSPSLLSFYQKQVSSLCLTTEGLRCILSHAQVFFVSTDLILFLLTIYSQG